MIFKIKSNKEDPYKGLAYILRKDKVLVTDGIRAVGTYYLNGMNAMRDPGPADFARQFRKTKEHWGKGNRENELQFFHIKISPNPQDGLVCSEALLGCAREICETLFPEFEAVIAVHNDTKTMHAHIIVNSVSCVTGRHLHYSKYMSNIDRMNDRAQRIGLKYFFSLTDKTPARDRKTTAERGMEKRGLKTDKERLKKIILSAAQRAHSKEEYVRLVQKEGVEMPEWERDHKDFYYRMPGWKHNVRGATLGSAYSKEALEKIYLGNAWADYQKTVPEGENFISMNDYIEIVHYGMDPVALGVDAAREFHEIFIQGIYPGTADPDLAEVTAEKETKVAPAAAPKPVQETVEIPTPAAVPEPAQKPAPFVTHVQPEEVPEVVSKPIREPAPMPAEKPMPSTIPAPAATPAPKPVSENVPIAAHAREEEIPAVVAKPLNLPKEYTRHEFTQMIVWVEKKTRKLIFEHSSRTIKNYSEAIFATYDPHNEEPSWESRCTDYERESAKQYVEGYKKVLAKVRQELEEEKNASQQPSQPVKKKDDGFYK